MTSPGQSPDEPDQPDEPAARAALEALPGLSWRPVARTDLPEVAALFATCERHDANPERQSLTGLREWWDSPRSRPDEDTLLARGTDGQVAALAWAGCNRAVTERRGVRLNGVVHPDHRGRGIGRAVLVWGLAHARTWDATTREDGFGPLVVRLFAPTAQADVRDLAERHGMAIERYFFEMSRPIVPTDLTEVTAPDGIRLVDWDPARSQEVHRVVDEAFRDHWGHADRTDEMWVETVTTDTFRPAWTVLALEESTGHLVGAALGSAWEQDWAATGEREGYTDELAVLRSHRGRGIASALLGESVRRYAVDGMDAAALGVDADNPTGALGLYEGLGYRRTASTCVHELTRA